MLRIGYRLSPVRTLPTQAASLVVPATMTAAAAVWVIIGTLRMVAACRNALPFGDQWGEIVTGRSIGWRWLISQHVEHRILFPRLVFWADRVFAHETNALNEAVIVAIQCGLTIVLVTLAAHARLASGITRVWSAGLCVALLFWAGQYQNFVWGFQVQFVGVVLAAAGTFATLALLRRPALALAGAIVIESIGVYTLASGVLIPFLAAVLAIILKRPKQHVAALVAVAVLLTASYLWGYHTPPESSNPLSAWRNIGGILLYLLAVLGAPIGNMALLHATLALGIGISVAAGALGVYVFCRLANTVLRPDTMLLPAQAALLAMGGFVLGMFTITAAGRERFGITSALASRYTSPAVVFWCCLILLLASRASRSGQVPASIQLCGMMLAVLMAATEADNSTIAQDWVSLRRAATPAILANVADADMLARVYANPADGEAADDQLGPLRRAGTTVFADPWAAWLGTKLTSHVAGLDPGLCTGTLSQVRRVSTRPVPGFRATGHAWRTGVGGQIAKLLITDPSGTVVGYGEGGISFAAIGIVDPAPGFRPDSAWIGAFSHAAPDSVSVYALVGQYACPLTGRR